MRKRPQLVESWKRIEFSSEVLGELLQISNVLLGRGGTARGVEPPAEFGDDLAEDNILTALNLRGHRMGGSMSSAKLGELPQQLFRADWILLCRLGDRIGCFAWIEPVAEPTVENCPEGEIGLGAVKNLGPGIDRSFHGVGAQQDVAETMNGGASQLVEPPPRLPQRRTLFLSRPVWIGDTKLFRRRAR